MHNTLIVLLGPTGIGKSRVAITIAERFGTEIISSDSRQFYKEMSIGTAVPERDDLQRVNHHFIQHISVNDYYSASMFEEDTLTMLSTLFRSFPQVVMAGGSGLYIDAVCGTIDNIPDIAPEIRDEYLRKFKDHGIESLRAELRLIDPEYYTTTDPRNPKRILRALEIYGSTGKTYSSYLNKGGKKREFKIVKAGLKMEREKLYNIIDNRVDKMVRSGLEDEARSLLPYRHLNALNTVGYKEFFSYFDGEITREKAIELIKRDSRRYAKRQITWWARDKEIEWFDPENIEGLVKYLEEKCQV